MCRLGRMSAAGFTVGYIRQIAAPGLAEQ